MLRTTAIVASTIIFGCVGGAAFADQSGASIAACIAHDIQAITAIENHGAAQDVPSRGLYGASLTVAHARTACREGRVNDAIALYELVLALGPVDVVSATARK